MRCPRSWWYAYKKAAVRAFRAVHEGARQVFLWLDEQKKSEEEKEAYCREFSRLVVEKAEALFNECNFGLGERCLAAILLLHHYGGLVREVEKKAEEEAVKGWFIPFPSPVWSFRELKNFLASWGSSSE